ncbi:hypothetical protein [Sphaerisporangium dianthi]|uniref:Uncharacterized protein n=1 Tax=Sphaerisporangium dianthi TaxID=1436120 RepID=A0ABV9CGI3_9ACTN
MAVGRWFRTEELAFPVDGGQIARLITMDNFRNLAQRARIDVDRATHVVSHTVQVLADIWPQVKREAPVPAFVRSHIDHRLSSLPLIRNSPR